MALQIEMFPSAIIELSEEITYHPSLQEKLQLPENSNLTAEDRLAVIAAHCQVLLNGYYTPKDIEQIAHICVTILRKMRTPLILQ